MLKHCFQCHKPFYVPLSLSSRRFCSRRCHSASRYVLRPCRYCRQSFSQRRSERPKRYCSASCRKLGTTGQCNPLWRGNRRHWRGVDWPQASQEARSRDVNTCQVCGRVHDPKEELPSVDHIIPFRMGGTNALVNLLTVCRAPCHTRKTALEIKLLRGDRIGFDQGLRQQGWPMDKVQAAFTLWGQNPQMPILFRSVGRLLPKFCKHGHPWTEENTRIYTLPSGKRMRMCVTCSRRRAREAYQ